MLKKIRTILVVSIALVHGAFVVANPEKPNFDFSYEEIGETLARAAGLKAAQKEHSAEDAKKMVQNASQEMSAAEKVKLACMMCGARPYSTQENTSQSSCEAMKTTVKDLELFFHQGKDHEAHLFSKIDNTSTALGRVVLAKKLTDPITDLQALAKSQALIKKMATDKQLQGKVEKIVSQVAQQESSMLSLWQPESEETRKAVKGLYAPGRLNFLNSNSAKLSGYRQFRFLLPLVGAYAVARSVTDSKEKQAVAYMIGGLCELGLFFYGRKNDEPILKRMHSRLSAASSFIKVARELREVVKNDDVVAQGLLMQHLGIEQLEKQEHKVAELKTLVDELASPIFSGDYSYFSDSGKILHAYKLTQELKDEFSGIAQALGEVDACSSVAKFYNKLQNSQATCCFVDFVDQDRPYMKLEGFWNPVVDPAKAVTNNIELGNPQGAQHAVITGANTSGKSTALKAAVASVVFSRLGIAPAKKAVMTPFAHIETSMNISDDTALGISRFKAETLRAAEMGKNLGALKERRHAFVVIDELFSGTNKENGEVAAHNFMKKITATKNAIVMLATHFKKPTELEKETKGACKNFKVEAHVDKKTGKIVRPFKLEPGINSSNIAEAVMQESLKKDDAPADVQA